MTTIGKFIKKDNDYVGHIETRLWTSAVSIVKVIAKSSEKSPDYRILAGQYEIGAAWIKQSKSANSFLSVTLDDPSFLTAISCSLHEGVTKESFDLVWSRS